MHRFWSSLLITTWLPFCWMAMMAVHEFGHMVGAVATHGHVTHVVLHPLAISRTDVNPNPSPLLVCWAGPVVGVLLPVFASTVFHFRRLAVAYLIHFLTGFCLISNGAYLAVGSFEQVGDAGDLLRYGSPIWGLWLFGLLTVPTGFWYWNGLGPHFGWTAGTTANPRHAIISLILFVFTLVISACLSPQN